MASKTLTVARGFSKETFEALLAGLDEPEWMQARRREAWRVFGDTPRPSRSDEAWRRTDLKILDLDQGAALIEPPPPERAWRKTPTAWKKLLRATDVAGGLLHVDGATAWSWLEGGAAARGVIFTDLHTALREHPALVEPHFMTTAVRPEHGYMAALHGAFWRTGTFLYVPRGVHVLHPLLSYTWWSRAESDLPHTLIVLEEGARAVLIEESGSCGATGAPDGFALNVGAVEILLGRDAQLDYVNVQNWERNVLNFTSERALLDAGATLRWVAGHLGSRLTKTFLDTVLNGPGATALLSGLYFADGVQHLDLGTEQNHLYPNTTSDLLYKGALKGQARAVWRGMIRVAPQAQRTDGYQANRNLLLSDQAHADSLPGLEIMADDVRCTHGSTVGQLDAEEIFYLMARGIPRPEAEHLVVNGFFAPILDRIPWAEMRERLAAAIAHKVIA